MEVLFKLNFDFNNYFWITLFFYFFLFLHLLYYTVLRWARYFCPHTAGDSSDSDSDNDSDSETSSEDDSWTQKIVKANADLFSVENNSETVVDSTIETPVERQESVSFEVQG